MMLYYPGGVDTRDMGPTACVRTSSFPQMRPLFARNEARMGADGSCGVWRQVRGSHYYNIDREAAITTRSHKTSKVKVSYVHQKQ